MRIGTRLRKIWRDIWARKVRTLLVSISIFIGVFGVVTLFSAGEILIKQLEQDLQPDQLAMIRLAVATSSEARINNQTELQRLRDLPGVTAISGRAVYRLAWKLPTDRVFEDGYIAAYTDPFDEVALEPPTLYRGDWPQAGQNQIAVERRFAEKYDLQIGDPIDLRILSSAADNTVESWTISGLIFQPYGEPGGTGPLDPAQLVFATYPDAQYIGGFNGLSHIYARYTDFATAEDQEEEFEAAIQSYAVSFTNIEDPADNGTISQTRTINRLLVILALIALIVSGFLVFNVVNAIVVEQRRQIGVLKSLGASRLDNFLIYSGIAVMYGLIGVIPGVILGVPAGFFAAKGLAGQSGTIIEEFSFTPTAGILGVVIGLAVPFLSSILPVFNGTRVSILEAMTDFGINARYGRGPLARLIAMLPLSITFRQALNIVNQKKFRLALIGTTLTVAVAAFMGIYAVFSSLTGKIDEVFTTIGSQFSINPSEGRSYDELAAILANIEGISAAEPGATLSIKIEGYDAPPVVAGPPGLFAFGINPTNPDIAPLSLKSGSMLTADSPANAVVISSRIADYMDKREGDTIIIRSRDQVDEFAVVGVASYPYDTVWFRWDTLAKLGGLVIGAPKADDYAMGTTMLRVEGYTGSLANGLTGVLGLNEDISSYLSFTGGKLFTPGANELIVSTTLAEKGGYQVGDQLTLILGVAPAQYTISGIFALPARAQDVNPQHPVDVIGMDWHDLAKLDGRDLAQASDYTADKPLTLQATNGAATAEVPALGLIEQAAAFLNYVAGGPFTAGEPQVVISEPLAAQYNYAVGDSLTLSLDDQRGTYTITGIFAADTPTLGLFWQELARLEGKDIDGTPYPNQIDVIMAQADPTPAQVDDKIAEVKEALLAQGITADFTNWVDFNQSITRYVTLFGLILNLAAALIAVVGAIGLLTSLSMSVFERQKEIGVMRSVGASSWAVTIQFLVEGLVVGIAAWAIGVPLSYLLSRGLGNALPFGDVFEIGYPPITLVIGLAGMLVIVTIASLWPSLSAARKTVSDILRYQ